MALLSKQDDGLQELQRQAKVRCNADGVLKTHSHGDVLVRIRELSWYGLVLDRVEPAVVDEDDHHGLTLTFTLPREFGELSMSLENFSVSRYEDVIGGEKLCLDVSLPEGGTLEDIRRYLYYRNRSFIRNSVRRNRSGPGRYFLYALWGICALLGVGMMANEMAFKLKAWWLGL